MYGFPVNNMSVAIKWDEAVEEYHKHYDDENGIHEYVESLLPVYYGEIYSTYHDYIGTPLNIEIEHSHVGMSFSEVMSLNLYDEFMSHFMEAFNAYEEEE